MDTSVKPEVEVEEEEEFVDSSSDSVLSEEWQDLSKSDYAKVIFCNLYHDADNGGVGCKFQITDNVHEDPCDFVGLFKVGESQCLVSKMLSETECEEDGKLLRCVFTYEELPSDLQDGFYQFQYITRDQEVCGASTPFEVKQAQTKEDSSDDDIVTENAENDFVLVQHILEKKNRMLEQLLEKFRVKNLALSTDMEALLETKSKLCQEKEMVIENLHQEIISLKADFARKQSVITQKDADIENLSTQLKNRDQAAVNFERDLDIVARALTKCQSEKTLLHKDVQILKQVINEKETLPSEPEQRILLEQLDDQKFMIRALEDSKQLALKEMSDLSESLGKRTKVLNQTRCELATCKGKVKESESIIEKQNEEISRLREEAKELVQLLEEKEEKLKMTEMSLATAVKEQPECDIAEEDVKKLLMTAFTEAEKFLALVDQIVEKIDFTDMFQEKAFYELKIMFFVLLGKMKKPNELSDSKENSLRKKQGQKDKKKTASRTLPSCQGQTSTNYSGSDNQKPDVVVVEHQKEVVTTHNKEVQACCDSSVNEPSTTNSIQLIPQEVCEKQLNACKEMIIELNDEIAKKNAVIEFISSEKVNLLKSELVLQETVREHAARIGEAAELYKKQFVEIEKLKKKLRHVRHSSKGPTSKVIGYESSSTAEDVSPLKMLEKAPPTKRPRKSSTKAAEKTASPKLAEKLASSKMADKQPQTLKALSKSCSKKAEKAALKAKKALKTHEKLILEAAQESISAVEKKVACCQERGTVSVTVPSSIPGEFWALTVNTIEGRLPIIWPDMVKERNMDGLSEDTPSDTGKSPPLRSISDSDTGEHVLRNSTVLPVEGNIKPTVDAAISSSIEATTEEAVACELVDEDKLTPSSPKMAKADSYSEPDNRDLQTVQMLFNEEIARVKNSSLSSWVTNDEECFDIPCVLCNEHFEVTSLSNVKLMDHLENEHEISMCPVCGQLFEAAVPKKYLEFHVNKHFQSQ